MKRACRSHATHRATASVPVGSMDLPERQAFCGVRLMSHTLHNLYAVRGTKVRNVLKSAGTLDLGRFFALLGKAPGNFPIVTR